MKNIVKKLDTLNIVHCGYLSVCAAYISFMYPTAWPACSMLATCGVLVAIMPNAWRQKAIGEISFLSIALAASVVQWLLHDNDPESVNGLCRIIIVTLVLVLVPNRPGLVRPIAMLAALELLLLDRHAELSVSIVIFLSTLALSSLFLDAWLRHQYGNPIGVRIRNRWARAPWLPMLYSVFIISLICFPSATLLQEVGHNNRVFLTPSEVKDREDQSNKTITLDDSLRIGNPLWSDQQPYIVARFFPDRSEYFDKNKQTYVRARTVPEFKLESQGQISWNSPKTAFAYSGPQIEDIALGSGATLIRFRSGDRFILRPDGSAIPTIEDFYFDSELNIYANEVDLDVKRYRCGLPRDSYIRTQQNAQRYDDVYLEVPPYLQAVFQQQIPQLEQWRILNPEQAAQQITLYLHRNCRYSTKNLPTLKDSPAHCLELFLFGDNARRIGHCQYFSSAATLLMRSCGHASRPVFGFSSNERDKEDKTSIILRAWHGHAWTEFINSSGNWQRLDTTPPGYLDRRIGPNPNADDTEATQVFAATDSDSTSSRLLYLIAATCICMILSLYLLLKPRKIGKVLSSRQKLLAQQQHALIVCAQQIGVVIKESHTLTQIVRRIEIRSGIKLDQDLQQHLAALYNHAQIPTQWPIQQIKAAVLERDTLSKNTQETAKIAANPQTTKS